MYLMYYEDDAGKRVYTLEVEFLTPFCNSMYFDGTSKRYSQLYASEATIIASQIPAPGPDCYAFELQNGANVIVLALLVKAACRVHSLWALAAKMQKEQRWLMDQTHRVLQTTLDAYLNFRCCLQSTF